MKKYDALIENYVSLCRTRGMDEGTLETRRREVERFGLWVKRKRPRPRLEDVKADVIISYLKARSHFRSRSTIQGCFSNLRCFFDYMVEEGVWRKNPLRWIPGPKLIINSHVPKCLKQVDVEKILEECFRGKEHLFKYELPALFLTIYSIGLRRGEATRLNIEDLNSEDGLLRIRHHKVSKERYIPVPKAVISAIEAYLPVRQNLLLKKGILDEKALFINKNGRRLQGVAISKHLFRAAQSAGVENFTVHQLRHTCATNLISNGVSSQVVQELLSHSELSTTFRYTYVAGPDKKEAITKHPLNDYFKSKKERGLI